MSCHGYVLAGGRSRRFGSDKALARLRGRPLLAWALDALAGIGVPAAVVAREATGYTAWCSAFVTAERPGLGPAEGLRAALEACPAPWALVLSVDMPGAGAGVLRPLLRSTQPLGRARIICYRDARDRLHPFPGAYHRSLLATLDTLGRGGSMRRILAATPLRSLGQEDLEDGLDLAVALRNVNRPEDLDTWA